MKVSRKARTTDAELYAAILESLLYHKTNPGYESFSILEQLQAQQNVIGQYGVRAMLMIPGIIEGDATESATNAMRQIMNINIIHSNLAGMQTFLTKFVTAYDLMNKHIQCSLL